MTKEAENDKGDEDPEVHRDKESEYQLKDTLRWKQASYDCYIKLRFVHDQNALNKMGFEDKRESSMIEDELKEVIRAEEAIADASGGGGKLLARGLKIPAAPFSASS